MPPILRRDMVKLLWLGWGLKKSKLHTKHQAIQKTSIQTEPADDDSNLRRALRVALDLPFWLGSMTAA